MSSNEKLFSDLANGSTFNTYGSTCNFRKIGKTSAHELKDDGSIVTTWPFSLIEVVLIQGANERT